MVERKQSDENQEERGVELTYDASCIWFFYLVNCPLLDGIISFFIEMLTDC